MDRPRRNRALSQPQAVAAAALFVLFCADLIAGLTHRAAHTQSGMQIVVGATGIFGCLVFFVIGFVINRLE